MKESLKNIRQFLPIQKCMAGEDVKNLADPELLAIILGTGSRDLSVIDLASEIITYFRGIPGLYASGIKEIACKPGMGFNKALKIHAAFELGKRLLLYQNSASNKMLNSPEKVWKLLYPEMACLKREEFRVIILNNKNRLLKKVTVSIGTVTEALIHPREIFREAIKEAAAAIIVAHNHPSGDAFPSKEDIETTKRIKEAGSIIGIELLDHVIIGSSGYISLKEAGYL